MNNLEDVYEKLRSAREIVDDVSKDYLGFQNFQRLQCACGYIREAVNMLKAQESTHPVIGKMYNDVDEDDIADVMNRIDDALEETTYQTLGYDNISTPFFQVLIGRR